MITILNTMPQKIIKQCNKILANKIAFLDNGRVAAEVNLKVMQEKSAIFETKFEAKQRFLAEKKKLK